jgi:hypothetical protein
METPNYQYQYLEEPISRIRQVNHKEAQKFVGCSDAEIEHLEASLSDGYKLPAAYKEFLKAGGHQFGRLFCWKLMDYDLVLDFVETKNQSWARYVLEQPKAFDSKVFIFQDSGNGSGFLYFNLDEGDDPPVYLFIEPMVRFHEARLECAHFSEYLLDFVKYLEKTYTTWPDL